MKVLTIVFRVGQDTHEALVNITEHKLGIRELQRSVMWSNKSWLCCEIYWLISLTQPLVLLIFLPEWKYQSTTVLVAHSICKTSWMLLSEFTGFNLNHFLVFLASLLASNPSFFLLRPSFSSFPQVETKGSQDPSETRQCPVYIL